MESETVYLEKVPLLVPIGVRLPYNTFAEFPTYCGAGDGIGDIIVPDTMYRLKVSPACYIHDKDWELAPPTWEAFHAANSRFLHNLIMICEYRSDSNILKHLRIYRCATYYMFVDSTANKVFWKIKEQQQKSGLWSDYPLVSEIIKDVTNHLSIAPNRGMRFTWLMAML